MEEETPRALQFGFMDEFEEPAGTEEASKEAKVAPARGRARKETVSSERSEADHARELKRRVDEVHNAARRPRAARSARSVIVKPETPLTERAAIAPVPEDSESLEPVDEFVTDGDDALSIAQFYERVRWALTQEFPEEIWITGEIRGLSERRGHHYFELADKGVESVGRTSAQQLEVACWARDWPAIARSLEEAQVDLEVGRVIRVRGKVSVWEGGSRLRFTLTALDVEALLGGIAAARRRLLAALEAEGLLVANRMVPLALVPLRIGIVTSPGSEAHRDFVGQLERSGFAFQVRLEPSLVQGAEAPTQITAALGRLVGFEPDLVVLVRGGGARGDLAAFDAEVVARAIATAPFPVWTGIGHTSDRSVADEVAQRSLITPTACGEAVVALVDAYWGRVLEQVKTASRLARSQLDRASHRSGTNAAALVKAVHHQLIRRTDEIRVANLSLSRTTRAVLSAQVASSAARHRALSSGVRRVIDLRGADLLRHQQLLRAYDPVRQLERGWSYVRDERGNVVRSTKSLVVGERLRTRFVDGEATSRVESTNEGPAEETP